MSEPVRYAVLLAKPEALGSPAVADTLAAFRRIPFQDAAFAVKNSWGLVAGDLSAEEAKGLAASLDAAGPGGLAVPRGLLEDLPEARPLAAAELTGGGLKLAPRSGEPSRIAPERLALLAAAGFHEAAAASAPQEQSPDATARIINFGILMATGLPIKVGGGRKEAPKAPSIGEPVFYLDLCLRKPFERFRIDAREFDYSCLGARMAYNTFSNLKTLLAELSRLAPGAWRSRGTRALLNGEPLGAMGYHGLADLDLETRWLLTLDALKNP